MVIKSYFTKIDVIFSKVMTFDNFLLQFAQFAQSAFLRPPSYSLYELQIYMKILTTLTVARLLALIPSAKNLLIFFNSFDSLLILVLHYI